MIQQIFDFLTCPGNGERIAGLVLASLISLGIITSFIYYLMSLLIDLFKAFLNLFKLTRKDRIVEVPKYVTPPENKEMDKYLTILKKIADDYNNGIKLQ